MHTNQGYRLLLPESLNAQLDSLINYRPRPISFKYNNLSTVH